MAKVAERSEPISLRLPIEILKDVEAVAAASERTRSWVMVRALKRYLATEGQDILAIAHGKQQIVDGDVHDMDAVIDEVDALIRAGEAA